VGGGKWNGEVRSGRGEDVVKGGIAGKERSVRREKMWIEGGTVRWEGRKAGVGGRREVVSGKWERVGMCGWDVGGK
jgi:hypothetical protein